MDSESDLVDLMASIPMVTCINDVDVTMAFAIAMGSEDVTPLVLETLPDDGVMEMIP